MTTRNYSSRSQQTTLTSAVTAGASTMVVQSGTALLGGQSIPAGTTFTIVIDPDTAIEEIVDATAVSTNTFTITRGIDGSSGQAHSAGAVVRHMAIGRDYREANAHIEATTGVHGISNSSSVVGTIDTQTLTNKTLTSPTITNPSISGAGVDASIVFEGATADAYETTLTVVDPTQDNTITMPNTTGTVVIATAVQTLTNKTLTSPTISGSPVITGLSSAGMSTSSATPKDYVDSILGSATAASTSAASAATSAASAATSAGSSETSAIASASSATASATSATASATSATASATSASAAATSASSAATSATAAATSAASAATSATSAAASATTAAASVATIAGYATTASNSASAAATSATSASASASAAATSASSAAASAASIVGDAAAAATSATSASASASAAATSATNAATSATSAATSASSSLTSANSASTSAASADTSATASATSASAAATSASSASTSASSSATSATSAATTYDEFDDRYLGSKSSAPTVDNDGNTLLVGAIYWNSTLNNMYVWSGTVWVQIATTTSYSAPTLGTTALTSGATISNVDALTINSTTIPTSKTLVVTTDKLSALAATTSAELAGVISDETGSGALVFATSPTLVTPVLGVATATSVNGTTIPSSVTLTKTSDNLSVFAATTSAQLAGIISDEIGTGNIQLSDLATSAQAASYTLVLADKGKLVEMSNASANNLTVPLNSSVAYPVGSQINILQTGAGQTTVVATGGVTINASPGLKLRAQWSAATLIKRATDTWVLVGDLSA